MPGRHLKVKGTRHRVTSTVECDDEAVAFALLNRAHPLVCGDDLGKRAVESRDGFRHFLGLCFPELCGPLDIGE